jgi:hypothetical protein
MSQFDWGNLDPYVVDGVQLADDLNQFRDALLSYHRGGARPPYAVPGMQWVNDAGGPAAWLLNFFAGATVGDIPLYHFDTAAGRVALDPGLLANTVPDPHDNSPLIATTGFVQAAIAAAIASSLGALFPPGSVLDLLGALSAAPVGWVLSMQGTIGSGASGATIRANADCANLYAHLWNGLSNTYAPVTGGRGATAAADFAANKPIGGLDTRGLVRLTADNQGGTAAGRSPGWTIGLIGGEPTNTLTNRQVAPHQHGVQGGQNTGAFGNTGRAAFGDGVNASSFGTSNGVDMGGLGPLGEPHNNMQSSRAVTTIVKL